MTAGRSIGVFYAYDDPIGSCDSVWIQGSIIVLIGIFRRVSLMDNIEKSNTMNCHLRAILTGMSEEAFSHRSTGEGATYREQLWRCIPCPEFGVELTDRSMMAHLIRLHGTEPLIDWDRLPVSQTEHLPLVYKVRFPTKIQSCQCLFSGCPSTSHSRSVLNNHFRRLHWGI